jgi:hypothetical protein
MELVIDNDFSETKKPLLNTTTNKPIPPKKKNKVTYEQILESMNMKVIDGKLVMVPHNDNDISNQPGLKRDNRWNKKVNTSIPQQSQPQIQVQQQEQEQPKQPLTPEQIKQMLWVNEMKRRQEINRIREVKSTKLFFSTPTTNDTNRGNIIYNNQSRIGYNMFKLNR